ncbi:hypothetical protein SDC9_159131 [bioreactor metagenome]|uniref:Uncharacterized protein n=1 Tax=bioreactor metagenome TaxID=1076179 RepID=A0A645FHU6_9ZZZZ
MRPVVVSQHPQVTITILVHPVHPVVSQTDEIALTGFVCFKGVAVELINTIPGSKPHIPFVILQDVHYRILRQSIFGRIMGKETFMLSKRKQTGKNE